MPGPQSTFEELARDAAERVQAARAAGEQLTFLPDEPQPGEGARAARGKGKATSQLREWLAARGFRMPEDALAEIAGLASTEDAFLTAMARTEQLLAWAETGGKDQKGAPRAPSTGQRLATFQFIFTAQLRALEAAMAYGLAKPQGDQAPVNVTQIVVAGGQQPVAQAPRGPDLARDVTPQARRIAPPPMPHEIVQNQQVAEPAPRGADDGARTE
jgi:hypothetical protein